MTNHEGAGEGVEPREDDEPFWPRCQVCGVDLPTDEAAIAHLNEALTIERIAAKKKAATPSSSESSQG